MVAKWVVAVMKVVKWVVVKEVKWVVVVVEEVK